MITGSVDYRVRMYFEFTLRLGRHSSGGNNKQSRKNSLGESCSWRESVAPTVAQAGHQRGVRTLLITGYRLVNLDRLWIHIKCDMYTSLRQLHRTSSRRTHAQHTRAHSNTWRRCAGTLTVTRYDGVLINDITLSLKWGAGYKLITCHRSPWRSKPLSLSRLISVS